MQTIQNMMTEEGVQISSCTMTNTILVKCESCSVVSDSLWPWILCDLNSPGQNTRMGSRSLLLQGIFPTQGLNSGLPHCRWILYQLSHQWSPRILKWVAYPFSRGSSQPRHQTRVSGIAGGFFTSWGPRESWYDHKSSSYSPWLHWDIICKPYNSFHPFS